MTVLIWAVRVPLFALEGVGWLVAQGVYARRRWSYNRWERKRGYGK